MPHRRKKGPEPRKAQKDSGEPSKPKRKVTKRRKFDDRFGLGDRVLDVPSSPVPTPPPARVAVPVEVPAAVRSFDPVASFRPGAEAHRAAVLRQLQPEGSVPLSAIDLPPQPRPAGPQGRLAGAATELTRAAPEAARRDSERQARHEDRMLRHAERVNADVEFLDDGVVAFTPRNSRPAGGVVRFTTRDGREIEVPEEVARELRSAEDQGAVRRVRPIGVMTSL